MAEDLDKKMEPEISDVADKAEEVIEEEASVVEAVEEKAEESVKETEGGLIYTFNASPTKAEEICYVSKDIYL